MQIRATALPFTASPQHHEIPIDGHEKRGLSYQAEWLTEELNEKYPRSSGSRVNVAALTSKMPSGN
jgi:hypothetical protein